MNSQKRKQMTSGTIKQANDILLEFTNQIRMERGDNGRLYLVRIATGERKAIVTRGGHNPAFNYGNLGVGYTYASLAVQIARWVKGETRRPLAYWGQSLGTQHRAVQALADIGYDDGVSTACIFCGQADAPDWWSATRTKRMSGPCCMWGECASRENAVQ